MNSDQLLWMIGLGAFAGGVAVGALLVWFWSKTLIRREFGRFEMERIRMETESENLSERLARVEAESAAAQGEVVRLKVSLAETTSHRESFRLRLEEVLPAFHQLQEDAGELRTQVARMAEARSADAEKIQWLQSAKEQMRDAFDALAHKTLQTQSDSFLKQAEDKVKTTLANVVTPVRENLTALEHHVRDLEGKREGAYQGMTEQIQGLSQTHLELQKTAFTLTQALKSPTVRGRWGEMQLRRVVEMAGMVPHVAFTEQAASKDGGRPDMIVRLPNAGILPVDAKAPLTSYMAAVEADDPDIQKTRLAGHAKAMRSRVRELSAKKYWAQFENAPDFVIMFLPNEACLGAAFDQDPDLLEFAAELQVLPATPVTLLAMLKAVAHGWQQRRITENTRQIAAQGQALYNRLETFLNHLSDLGKQVNRTVEGYNRTLGSFERRLLPVARRFQEMEIVEGPAELPEPVDIRARQPDQGTGLWAETAPINNCLQKKEG